jgi:hypothetical protein
MTYLPVLGFHVPLITEDICVSVFTLVGLTGSVSLVCVFSMPTSTQDPEWAIHWRTYIFIFSWDDSQLHL